MLNFDRGNYMNVCTVFLQLVVTPRKNFNFVRKEINTLVIELKYPMAHMKPGSSKNLRKENTSADAGRLLIQAVKTGNEVLARKLISLGIPVNVRDQFGCEPIYYAARYNHLTLLKLLVECDAFVNTTTLVNRTPLQIAAYHGHSSCVQYLIDMQANVNAVDGLRMSALHWAAENNHKHTVEILLKSGADTSLINKFGKSAQKLAAQKNNVEIYELLEDNYVSDPSEVDEQDAATKTFSMFLSQPSMVDESSVLKNRLLESGFKGAATANKDDTIKLFEQHGIKLLPVDESTLVANALKRGQTAVLTEAGKLALKKTEPSFLHNLFQPSSSNPFIQMSSKIVEKERLRRMPQKSRNVNSETDASKAKRVRTNDSLLTVATASEESASIRPPKKTNLESKTQKYRKKNTITTSEEGAGTSNIMQKYQELEKNLKFSQEQLSLKSQAVNRLTNQLDVSLKLLKNFKTKYEMKEREASLYKIQLQNLLKSLAKRKLTQERRLPV